MYIFLFISIVCSLLSIGSVSANENCFIAKENDKVLKREGNCITRYGPQSTFKIPLALMGYDSGVLEDERRPVFQYKEGYDFYINVCKGDHDPKTWMRDSCLWYSRLLTPKLGMKKFRNYITKFHYGNMDVSGDEGKNNGLTHSWVSSSLMISPEEQVDFLQKVTAHQLPISEKAYKMTKNIIYIQDLSGGWKLYGKTGSASQHGWFVGWIEKNGRTIEFADHIVDQKKENVFPSFRARNDALIKLWYLIDELEK